MTDKTIELDLDLTLFQHLFSGLATEAEKLFVRQSYIDLDGIIMKHYKNHITRNHITRIKKSRIGGSKDFPKNLVITGTPGVGKSMFLIYQLYLARSRERNVIVQVGSNVCVFSSTPRFTKINVSAIEKRLYLFSPDIMFFYDPGSARVSLEEHVPAFTVVFASHNPQHYRVLKKFALTKLYMPVWTLNELLECAQLCYPSITAKTVSSSFGDWGGSPRCVFDIKDGQIKGQLEQFLCSKNLSTAICDMSHVETSGEPFLHEWLIHLSIIDGDYEQVGMRWPSDFVMSRVTEALHNQDDNWKTKTSRMTDSILHGRLFENDVLKTILGEQKLQAIPLNPKRKAHTG